MILYKKFATFLVICNLVVLVGSFNVLGIRINQVLASEAFQTLVEEETTEVSFLGLMTKASSNQRNINVEVISKKWIYDLTDEDYNNLLKIVEAEAGGEDQTGKMLVANVVLNRVDSGEFPDSVTSVIFQKKEGVSQFSPISDGRFDTVTVSDETVEAVELVLLGEDMSMGALYFTSRQYADPSRMVWFDTYLTKLFAYGNHEFFA
ncbi:MAG: cell wall hydrolase [Eubacteriales bacterium]